MKLKNITIRNKYKSQKISECTITTFEDEVRVHCGTHIMIMDTNCIVEIDESSIVNGVQSSKKSEIRFI